MCVNASCIVNTHSKYRLTIYKTGNYCIPVFINGRGVGYISGHHDYDETALYISSDGGPYMKRVLTINKIHLQYQDNADNNILNLIRYICKLHSPKK